MVNIGLVLIILVVIAGIIWQLRSNHRRRPRTRIPPSQIIRYGPARQLETLRHNRKFWGVEIQSGICEASKALAGRQLPFPEAPSLPLTDCAASFCTCTYVGLWERRKCHRRSQPDRRKAIRYLHDHPNRRCRRERRKADVWSNRSW
jgi:phage tail protein X